MEDDTAKDPDIKPLVSETDLSNALRHLEILLSSQPSPALPQRLVSPILLPLWALTNFAKSTGRSTWYERTILLLRTYIKTSPDESALQKIQGRILYSGGEAWEFGPGSEGGIEIRFRVGGAAGFDLSKADARVQEFLGLLEDDGVSGGVFNDFFLRILRVWLGRRNSEVEDPVEMFTTLKILQEVLGRYEEMLAKNPTQILQIVKGVLDEHMEYLEGLNTSAEAVITPSLDGLGKIISNSPPPYLKADGGGEELGEENERTQTLTMALSLLSVIISNPTTKLTHLDERLIQILQPALAHITASKFTNPDIKTLMLNITSLLTLHSPSTNSPSSPTTLLTRQKETYLLALSYLRDPLIPVRAHGLHLLRELILSSSPVINIQTTLSQLISQLKDDDSFVYLNTIKCLSALTDRHSGSVTRMLVEAYLDNEEEGQGKLSLDQRLRLGEALLATVQRLGGALVGETARLLSEAMISTASSRRRRHHKHTPPHDPPKDEEGENPVAAAEDERIRTSALSILGAAIETNPTGLGSGIISNALDVCVSILTLETAAEGATLRRAAVVCISGVLKALVGGGGGGGSVEEAGVGWREGVWEVVRERVSVIRRVVGYLGVTDGDGLVREQARVVMENLEAVVWVWVGRGGTSVAVGGGMLGNLEGVVGV
ncbi:unnamed protein product [Tuber melanosporum]|uniref:(Perigord truffle) hypothetical protein n=1 Tax=Tuber melanosporum (strain Mel28) TaxID=656061 RepID=D5GJ74_TUBMM|nr:uncharacterized protein GSTUM_00008870001 [Tuber melanosporum]CAZ84567.1 unnamed protein product [Tuber melanosporum]